MRAGTTRTLPSALTAKSASFGARLTAFSSRAKYCVRRRAGERERRVRVGRELEDLGEPPARDPQARRAGGDDDRRGDHLRRAPLRGRRATATVTLGASTRTGSATGARAERRQRADDPSAARPRGRARGRSRRRRSRCAARAGRAAPRGAARRSPARAARARRSAPRRRRARAARGPPGRTRARGGGSRGRSRSRRPAARPSRRRRPSRPRRRARCGVTRKRLSPAVNVTGHAREPRRALLEQPLRVGGRQAADVDAGDPGAARELLGRAGEDEAERDPDEHDDAAEARAGGSRGERAPRRGGGPEEPSRRQPLPGSW